MRASALNFVVDETLQLRSAVVSDADALFSLIDGNRRHLDRWLTWVMPTRSAADTRIFLESVLDRDRKGEGYALLIQENGQTCGLIGLDPIDLGNRSGDLGYWLVQGAEGRGLVTRSARAVIDHAFEALNLNRVTLRAAVENSRSRAVAERLGFEEEGILREAEKHDDGFVDLVLYSLLRRDRVFLAEYAGDVLG